LKKNQVDLLVIDMIMEPGIDGLETCQKILELSPGQKAVIASGYAETDRGERKRAGRSLKIQNLTFEQIVSPSGYFFTPLYGKPDSCQTHFQFLGQFSM
jgi:CheY-like chemotaxis protein